jgi:asparagine synthase (glutamine-hydrolysing)
LFDFETPADLLICWHGWSASEIERLCGEPAQLERSRFFRIYRRFSSENRMDRYSALMGNLPDDWVHQAAQATGLRVRFPYGDAGVENLVRSLPQECRYNPEHPKRLLRCLLARYVPQSLWDQPKHGFDFPFVALMRHKGQALLNRHLAPALIRRGD